MRFIVVDFSGVLQTGGFEHSVHLHRGDVTLLLLHVCTRLHLCHSNMSDERIISIFLFMSLSYAHNTV